VRVYFKFTFINFVHIAEIFLGFFGTRFVGFGGTFEKGF